MITIYCNRTDKEFWNLTPRQTITLIDQWRKIENGRYKIQKFIGSGGDPDELGTAEQVKKKELEWGQAMW
jgi:hypothetical protein